MIAATTSDSSSSSSSTVITREVPEFTEEVKLLTLLYAISDEGRNTLFSAGF